MTAARLAALPIDHLLAEMAALPLASEAALRLCITQLDPDLQSENTASLWREAERQLLSCFPAFSVDEAVSIRDYYWFGWQDNQKIPLHTYLRWLAGQFLEVRGPTAMPILPKKLSDIGSQSDCEPMAARARLAWRWLSFALPPDLLIAALTRNGRGPTEIDLLSPSLDRHLKDKGYAEPHLHIGAALEFPQLWVSAVRAIVEPGFIEKAFESPGAGLDEGKALAPWLLRAAIARYVLAAFLSWGCREHENFRTFVQAVVIPKVLKELGPGSLSSLLLGLSDLRAGRIEAEASGLAFPHLQGFYAQLLGGRFIAGGFPNALVMLPEGDPITAFLPGESNPEMRWVAEGLAYLDKMPEDRYFAVLFWQAIRVRALFYRHVVQRPMTPGLQWFIRFYARIKPARPTRIRPAHPNGIRALMESAATINGIGRGLKSLEFRTAPDPDRSNLLLYVGDIDIVTQENLPNLPAVGTNRNDAETIEIGLVLHFTKDRGGDAQKGRPKANWRSSYADPGNNPTGYRYARFYNQKRNEAQALAWALWHFPISLGLIRGIDVCTDELGVPTWVLAPLFRYVREVSNTASENLHQRCGVEVPPLRVTAHTGEDFVHLLTGLRNVDEVVRRFDMREGDRIGHGMALGVDPLDWCERAGRIPMPCEDRLFDLTWEWIWYARESIDPPPGRAPMLEREIARLSQKIFGDSLLPFEIELFVEYLYGERWLGLLGFPNGRSPKLGLEEKDPLILLQKYLTGVIVFRKGRETEWVDPSDEGEVLSMLQSGLRRKLGQRGLAVEVNPSSNLLIGDMCDLTKHPLWRLRPPPGSNADAPPVSICIGSDDPLTFATNLRQEYQFVHDALVLAGCSEAEASQWLDEVRETGLDYRFTLDRNKKPNFILPENLFQTRRINPLFNFGRSFVRLPP
jgi:hypothetical protein